ncbi:MULTISPECIES: iron-siderophore ABC transporter substrate-binding protein [Streptomyces]|uniref:Iron ABC transporter substrate-binding protein n=2 Tax=Streptomyces TaxID=1883 RepID=A0A2N8PGH8_STRNR|nr:MULTISPECIES: iron-siderophore ABC transporter substrate-binding protein [Streptomyces]PNE40128.1 iron ABC transporter substrate-binding protein [Streptomyces noursei]UJB39697.1 iron-siderophore ABC transporter substrate-binding protein [Streptomyces sp. A1-5]SHL36804.1 iron complex transport system substrate-binding protein [Streptomyces yunnanensis]
MTIASRRITRRLFTAAAATSLLLVTSACGGGGKGDAEAAGGSHGAFPVSIKSALGTATIKKEPKRIVTLGQGSAETAIALGHTPVGVEEYAWGSDKSGYLPWVKDAVKKAGDPLPKQFKGGDQLDIEAITELAPDLILAPWSGITAKQYDVLKDIAPTVAYPDKAWSTRWDEQINTVAKAVGQPEKGTELIKGIKKQLADAAASRPNYKNVTFSYIYTSGPGTLGVFKPAEQRVEMVKSLGLQVDPVVNTFKETDGTASSLIGLENADKLNKSDVLFTFYSDDKTRRETEGQSLYAAMPAIKKGAVVASSDNSFVTASSMINPLTVPYSIKRYLPLIDSAVKKAGK